MKFGDLSFSSDEGAGWRGSDSDAPVRMLPRDKVKEGGRRQACRKNRAARRSSADKTSQAAAEPPPCPHRKGDPVREACGTSNKDSGIARPAGGETAGMAGKPPAPVELPRAGPSLPSNCTAGNAIRADPLLKNADRRFDSRNVMDSQVGPVLDPAVDTNMWPTIGETAHISRRRSSRGSVWGLPPANSNDSHKFDKVSKPAATNLPNEGVTAETGRRGQRRGSNGPHLQTSPTRSTTKAAPKPATAPESPIRRVSVGGDVSAKCSGAGNGGTEKIGGRSASLSDVHPISGQHAAISVSRQASNSWPTPEESCSPIKSPRSETEAPDQLPSPTSESFASTNEDESAAGPVAASKRLCRTRKTSVSPHGTSVRSKPNSASKESEPALRPVHPVEKARPPVPGANLSDEEDSPDREIAFFVSKVPIYVNPGKLVKRLRQMAPSFPKLKHENYEGLKFHGVPVNLPDVDFFAFGSIEATSTDNIAIHPIVLEGTLSSASGAIITSNKQIMPHSGRKLESPVEPKPACLAGPKATVPGKPVGAWGSGKVLFSTPMQTKIAVTAIIPTSDPALSLESTPTAESASPPISPVSTAPSGTSSEESAKSPGPTDSAVFVEMPSDVVTKFDANRYLLKQRTVARGLFNPGNMCFLNSILQALVYTPPFYNFIMALSQSAESFADEAPLTESIITQFHQVPPFDVRGAPAGRIDALSSEHIYDALKIAKQLSCVKGTQEDAEEFLTHILDGVHEEMIRVGNANGADGRLVHADANGKPQELGGEEWVEVGPKNKVSTTRRTESKDSPITRIFGGVFRSTLKAAGQKDSVTFEPFQTLQLDVTMDGVNSVDDALRILTQPEIIDNYTVKHAKVQAQKQVLIDQAPPVLVLQLKRFMYTPEGGYMKNTKPFRYPPVQNVKSALTPAAAGSPRSRTYVLTAVVFHHGSTLSTGHYTCAVQDHGAWSVLDDAHVSKTDVASVCGTKASQEAYLLFYTLADCPASTYAAQGPTSTPSSSSCSSASVCANGGGAWQKARSRPRTPPREGNHRAKQQQQPPWTTTTKHSQPQPPALPPSPPAQQVQRPGPPFLEPHLNFQRLMHRRQPYGCSPLPAVVSGRRR